MHNINSHCVNKEIKYSRGKTFLFYYRKDTLVVYESLGVYEEFLEIQDNPSYEKVYP